MLDFALMVIDQRILLTCCLSVCITWYFFFLIIPDTESDKASRRQLKETIYSALFDMNVPAVCAINQVDLLLNSGTGILRIES